MTVRAGVVGSPARHSLSPLIHGAWLQAAGVDGRYELYDLPPDGFAGFIEKALVEGLRGVNVTLPFKEQALICADQASDIAASSGAANVLVFEDDGAIRADNTDGLGLLYALTRGAPDLDLTSATVVLLGAGGAAKGAAVALAEAGVPDLRIVNRTAVKAEQLAVELMLEYDLDVAYAMFEEAIGEADLLINATSAGLGGADDRGLDLTGAGAELVVMDMVYSPLITPLLASARARGLRTVDGLEMLIGQAIPSFEMFFGRPPPAEVDVRALAIAELERRG